MLNRKPRDFPSLAGPLALKVAKIKTEGHKGRVRGKEARRETLTQLKSEI